MEEAMKAIMYLCLLLVLILLTANSATAQLIDPFTNRPVGPTGGDSTLQSRIIQADKLAADHGYFERTPMAESKALQPNEEHTVRQLVGGSKPFIFVLTCDANCGSLQVAAKFVRSGQPINVTISNDGHFAFLETRIAEPDSVEISTSIRNCSRESCTYYVTAYGKF